MLNTHDSILAAVRDGSALTRKGWAKANGRQFKPLSWGGQLLVTEWLEALSSGTIPQGEGRMRRGDDRCCLAVLCETETGRSIVTITVDNMEKFAMGLQPPSFAYDGHTTNLPDSVADLIGSAGVGDPILWSVGAAVGGSVDPDRLHGLSAAGLNDTYELTFGEIAEVVKHWFSDDLTSAEDLGADVLTFDEDGTDDEDDE